MAEITDERALEIATQLDYGIDDFFRLNTKNKIKVIAKYLDLQIGDEPKAEIKKITIPGVGFDISGGVLERASDMTINAIATLIVNKWFTAVPAPE